MKILILFEHWAGHTLLSERVIRPHLTANRPISFPSVPVSEGIEIRHGCQFVSSLVRALATLPGGIGGFLPCGVGSHMSRLRHLGWNQCPHGLTSGPLETCHHQSLKAVCGVLVYPKRISFGASGWHPEAPILYYSFCHAFSPWSLPRVGNGGGKRQSVTPGHLLDESGQVGKRVRLTKKTRPVASSGIIPDAGHSTPRRRKRLRPPSSEGEGGEVGVSRNLFPRLGVGRVFAPGTPGTCLRREQA